MGCDIHIRIERRVDGKWQKVPWTNAFRSKYLELYPEAADPAAIVMPKDFDNRNYDLFGILANVRNGTWGDELPPIAEPRGVPNDVTPPRPDADDEYSLGDHSFSWLMFRELEGYDWNAKTKKCGWVSHEQAAEFRRTHEPPTSYAAGGNRGEYITWTQTRRSAVRDWPGVVLPILRTLGEPDDIRLVFGFDS